MQSRHVLVTGASGALGHTVVEALSAQGHRVRGYDRNPPQHCGEHELGDILDVDGLFQAARDVEVIVHFAAVPDRDDFVQRLVPNNIIGTYNVFEVARMRKVARVVYASSCRVMSGLDWANETLGLGGGLAPGDHYGVTKATGELLGHVYARRFDLTVLCARVGWFVRNRYEAGRMESSDVGRRMYLSHADASRFFVLAVERELPPFSAVFVTSKNQEHSLADLEPARSLLGYEPRDTWPEGSSWPAELHFPSPSGGSSLLPEREDADSSGLG